MQLMMFDTPRSAATRPSRLSTPQDAVAGIAGPAEVSPALHGFGGLHGGIGLALALRAVLDSGLDETQVRSIQARFSRAVRDEVTVTVDAPDHDRTIATAHATLTSRGTQCVSMSALFGRSKVALRDITPPMPAYAAPTECDEFAMPIEFVPFGAFIEIRPTTAERPYAGGDDAHLAAWIRLRDDPAPVDLARLVILLDALAPSAAATMTDLVAFPTVELSIRPAPGVHTTTSPWMLLDTHSTVSADGWVDESLSAWAPDGTFLASASQIRLANSL
jgi:acyl-CoA thioesterase